MRRLLTIFAVLLTMTVLSGCSGAKGFKVTSCSIASISPSGLKGVKAVLNVGVRNPMMAVTVAGIKGAINKGGLEFATFQGGSVDIPKKSEGTYPLHCSGAISKGIGLSDLLRLSMQQDFDDMTVDMDVKVKLKCGLRKTIRFKDIKVTDLMEPAVASAYLDIIINETMI
ncbi:MAG: hypothetical protein Q4G10_01660 [Bacteroidia bacterium]|nr:hypothetical protein [Bacteroidia bacterium]